MNKAYKLNVCYICIIVLPAVLVPRQTIDTPHELHPIPEYTRPDNMSFPTQEPTNTFQLPGRY